MRYLRLPSPCCPGTKKTVDVNESLLAENDRHAAVNRDHIEAMGAFAINLISSPGSGKTTLLEKDHRTSRQGAAHRGHRG